MIKDFEAYRQRLQDIKGNVFKCIDANQTQWAIYSLAQCIIDLSCHIEASNKPVDPTVSK